MKRTIFAAFAFAALGTTSAAVARADVVIDWYKRADAIIGDARLGTPPAIRAMAILQTAVYDAVKSLDQPQAIEAAVAAANREVLSKLLPAQQSAIDAAFRNALASIPEGPARSAGVARGVQTASAVLAARSSDGASQPESYRPLAQPGVYVPTTIAAMTQWPARKPWLMSQASQFRPAPPPALGSAHWARDYNEVKVLGSKASKVRTTEQTEIGRFWDYSLPAIYHGVVRSVAQSPGRSVLGNARMFAAVAQSMDDAMIAVFDAKYHYNLWRPATAIRNGDVDGNEATERDASWSPLIDAPMHPEYPSGHSILAAAVGAILKAEIGNAPAPELATTSPTGNHATRRWKTIDAFVEEVSNARIYGGIHFRTATTIGEAMGQQIGKLAITHHYQSH